MTGKKHGGSEERLYDLVIVGAGPAGISAALTACACGLRTIVVDEQQDIGGQILRQPPAGFSIGAKPASPSLPNAASLLAAFRDAPEIDRSFGTTVWGVFQCGGMIELATSGRGGGRTLLAKTLLFATGAYDLPVAFPGWTLPGVMSAGGVQTLLKSQFLLPGRRFVLAGSHPLLLLVADLLLDAGAEIAEVAIARPMPGLAEMVRTLPAIPGHISLFLGLAAQLNRLRRHKVPLRFGTIVRKAEGNGAVQTMTLSDVDQNWTPIGGTERSIEADTLVVGYGLLASSELAQQAGCAVDWQPVRGGWVVSHDADMRSSVENIFIAGEPAGVKGAEMAALEGRLAALAIAAQLGALSEEQARAKTDDVRAKLAKARAFSDAVLDFFALRLDRLAGLATDDTLVCRCEEVSAGAVRRFLGGNRHVSDINSVKLACRTGMGLCQGRYCQHTVAQLTAGMCSATVPDVGRFSAQAPVKPVTVRELIAAGDR